MNRPPSRGFMAGSRFTQCHIVDPRLGEFPGLMRRRVSRSFPGAGCAYRLFGSLAPLWCCQVYPACFRGFSYFVGQRSCQNFGGAIELVYDWWTFPLVAQVPKARVGQGSLLSGMSGVTAQDALYASLKRNERAQSTNGLLKDPGASTSARRSKVRK